MCSSKIVGVENDEKKKREKEDTEITKGDIQSFSFHSWDQVWEQ